MQIFHKKWLFQTCRPGYLLLEIIAAVGLFAIASLISAQYYWHIIEWQHNADRYAQATTLCQEMIEQKLVTHQDTAKSRTESKSEKFSVKCSTNLLQASSYELPLWMSTQFLDDLKMLKTTVTWKSATGVDKKLIFKSCARIIKQENIS